MLHLKLCFLIKKLLQNVLPVGTATGAADCAGVELPKRSRRLPEAAG